MRPIENYAASINESKFSAVPQKRDGRALGQVDADAIRKNALHHRGFDPGDFFKRAAPRIQRNTQYAAPSVAHKLLQHRFAADNVVAVDFNLFRLDEQHPMPIKQKASGRPRGGDSRDSYDAAK